MLEALSGQESVHPPTTSAPSGQESVHPPIASVQGRESFGHECADFLTVLPWLLGQDKQRPLLKHLLLPRTTGFAACLDALSSSGKSPIIYDVTIAYRCRHRP